MRTLTIASINELEHGEIVPSFTGTVHKVYKQKSGPGEYGPWYLQNMEISDDTGEITATWTGPEPLERLQGSVVEFRSIETKHGLQGIKREIKQDKEDPNKVYEGVRFTGTCQMTVQGGNGAQEDPAPAPSASPARSNPPAEGGVAEAKQHAMRAANLMLIAMDSARWTFMQYGDKYNVDLTDAHFQALCATIFINLADAGLVKKMPTTPIGHAKKHAAPAAKPKPAPAPPPPVKEEEPDDDSIPF